MLEQILIQVGISIVTAGSVAFGVGWFFNQRAAKEADSRLELLAGFLERFAASTLGEDKGIRIEFSRDAKGRIIGVHKIVQLSATVGPGED